MPPWTGEPGTAGTVAVVGAGKMGLPLAAQFAVHGWTVIAVDVNEAVVDAINAGRSARRRGARPRRARRGAPTRAGRLRATTDGAAAAREADVVVLIVPVMLDDAAAAGLPLHGRGGRGDRARAPRGLARHLRDDAARRRHARTGTRPRSRRPPAWPSSDDLFVAFSPERLYLAAPCSATSRPIPKLVGGIGPASTDRAAAFYASVLDAEVVAMTSAEAAEFSKLADTTYRDVNIALANEFARYADRDRASTSWRSSRRPTASRTATSTSPASASAATASRSTRTSCCRGRRRWSSSGSRGEVNDGQVGRAVETHRRRRSAAWRACRSSCSA